MTTVVHSRSQNENEFEVRFVVRKEKNPELFNKMKKYPEVQWSTFCKLKISEYCNERVKK
jgi:hypothetical protein